MRKGSFMIGSLCAVASSPKTLVHGSEPAVPGAFVDRDLSPSGARAALNDLDQAFSRAIVEGVGRERVDDGLGLLSRPWPKERNLEPAALKPVQRAPRPTSAAILELSDLLERNGIQHGASSATSFLQL